MKVIGKVYVLVDESTRQMFHFHRTDSEARSDSERHLGPVFHDVQQAFDIAVSWSQVSHREVTIWELDEENEVLIFNPELLDTIKAQGKVFARMREGHLI